MSAMYMEHRLRATVNQDNRWTLVEAVCGVEASTASHTSRKPHHLITIFRKQSTAALHVLQAAVTAPLITQMAECQ
jgi:hypothetical protein